MMNRLTGYFITSVSIVVMAHAFTYLPVYPDGNIPDNAEVYTKNTGPGKNYLSLNQENHAPVVKINSPEPGGVYGWNTTATYTIGVADKEDGDSKFEEITPNEVFLEIKYIKDSSKIKAAMSQPAKKDPPGLTVIRTSNCLNCHAFHAVLIGPSFYDIAKRYPATVPNIDLLSKRVREGASGVWGKVVMPSHPELSVLQIKEVVKWILGNAAKPDMNYFTGTEGSFRITPPVSAKDKGFLMLTASYTDHGLSGKPNTALKGQDKMVMRIR